MMQGLWLFLLPVAAFSGWFASSASHHIHVPDEKKKKPLSKDYILGLNFLLNEEPDKALDVFIKMLDVDSETVETHLALGNLFRKRGEVNRAIRIHQNLIARPSLEKEIRSQAQFALAKDYLSAGVLDRSEKLYLELISMNEQVIPSAYALLDIYQQEKEWGKAIEIAHKMESLTSKNMSIAKAHYYCELAEASLKIGNKDQSVKYLKRALSIDKKCVRASLIFANLESLSDRHKHAIRHLKHIKNQDPDFFSEAIMLLMREHQALSKEKELVLYFKDILQEFPKIPIVIMLSEQIRQWKGDKIAAGFVADYVRKHPSIAGLHRLVELHLPLAEDKAKKDLIILHSLTQKLLNSQPTYRCENCGFAGKTLHWQCPSCKQWSTVKPTHTFEEEV